MSGKIKNPGEDHQSLGPLRGSFPGLPEEIFLKTALDYSFLVHYFTVVEYSILEVPHDFNRAQSQTQLARDISNYLFYRVLALRLFLCDRHARRLALRADIVASHHGDGHPLKRIFTERKVYLGVAVEARLAALLKLLDDSICRNRDFRRDGLAGRHSGERVQ